MSKYPLARWSVSEEKLGASVWTRKISEGEGGGYYLYGWKRGTTQITVEELVEGVTKEERQWPVGKRSKYVTVDVIDIPESVRRPNDPHGQESEVAYLMFVDMKLRFGEIAEWILYGNDGKPVWFHHEVTGQ